MIFLSDGKVDTFSAALNAVAGYLGVPISELAAAVHVFYRGINAAMPNDSSPTTVELLAGRAEGDKTQSAMLIPAGAARIEVVRFPLPSAADRRELAVKSDILVRLARGTASARQANAAGALTARR